MSAEGDDSKPKKAVVPRMYTMRDLDNMLDGKDVYSAFGKIQVSTKATQPAATFGKAGRGAQAKVYTCKAALKELLGT